MEQVKIGLFFQNYVPLLFAQQNPNLDFYYFIGEDSDVRPEVEKILPREKLIFFKLGPRSDYRSDCESEAIIKQSNLTNLIKENKINYLVPSIYSSRFFYNWGRENGVKIIFTDYKDKILENKLYFDRFLEKNDLPKPKSFVFNYSKSATLPGEGRFVIQDPGSSGGYGTFFVNAQKEIENLIKEKKIKINHNYLAREFIEGKSYGITVFIAPGLIALSAARRQCFYTISPEIKKFAGIQWVGNDLPNSVLQKIEQTFLKIGDLFYQKKFFGFANFDFMIDNHENIFLIECNPRISAATAHLLKYPQLISNLPVGQLFIESFLEQKEYLLIKKHFPCPHDPFAGSVLNLCVFAEEKKKVTVKNRYSNGYYFPEGNQLNFSSFDIRKMGQKEKELVFFSQAKIGQTYKETSTVAYTLSNYPLFDQKGEINEDGKQVLETFKY